MAIAPEHHVDRTRLLSFVGLVIGRLGPRAHQTVSGVFLALLVGEHTRSLFLTTFALSAHRLVSWALYPIVGRLSDRADTRFGRRTPYMAGGLLVLGACTAFYTQASGFWTLVVLMVVGRLALVVHRLPGIPATPEIFGGSRWGRAAVLVGVGGGIVGLSIRLTVIATWEKNDPSTWNLAYYMAAGYILVAGLAILFLVREAPAAKEVEIRDVDGSWRERVAQVLALPNARVLLGATLIGVAAAGFTDRAFPIYAQHVLGAGGADLALAGLVAGPAGLPAIPIGYAMAKRIDRRRVTVLAALVGAAYAFAHLFLTHLWQSVALGVIAGPFFVAAVIAIAPMALQLFPRSGGMAERLGLFAGPIALVGVLASYTSSLTFDFLVHDYRVIWAFAGVFGLLSAFVMTRLVVPPGQEHTDIPAIVREVRGVLRGQGETEGLFHGRVTRQDADTVALVEILQRKLDPYAEREVPEVAPVREAVFGADERDLEG